MIRLIACDLDGTLLDANARPRPRSARLLHALWQQGVVVVLATGRSWRTAIQVQRELKLRGPIIAHNGAYAFNTALDEEFFRRSVPAATARAMVAFADQAGIMVRCYLGAQHPVVFNFFTPDHRARWLRPEDRSVRSLAQTLDVDPLEIFFLGSDEVDGFVAQFGLLGADYELSIFPRGPFREVNICAPGVDKVEALAALASRFQVSPTDVLALGDGLNDVHMLRWAGLAVAMAHGAPEARAAADYVSPGKTGDPVEEGLLWALPRLSAVRRYDA